MKGAKVIQMEGEDKGKEEVVIIPVGKYIDDRINEGVDRLGNSINSQIALLRNDTKGLETSIGKDIEGLKRYQTLMTAIYGVIVAVGIGVAGWFMYQSDKNTERYLNQSNREIQAYKENSNKDLQLIKQDYDRRFELFMNKLIFQDDKINALKGDVYKK